MSDLSQPAPPLGAAIFSATEFGNDRRPFRESLRMIRDSGYQFVSLLHRQGGPKLTESDHDPQSSLIDITQSDPQVLRRVVNDFGLRIGHLRAGFFDLEDARATTSSVDTVKVAFETARSLGVRYLSAGLMHRRNWGGHVDKRPYLDRLASVFDALETFVADDWPRIGVDIHCNALVETVDDCRYLLRRSPSRVCGLCLNIGHLTTARQPGWELVVEFPERIVLAAWKDHVATQGEKGFLSVRMGRGASPFPKYVAAFKKVKSSTYHVHATEHEPFDDQERALRMSYQYWLGLWRS